MNIIVIQTFSSKLSSSWLWSSLSSWLIIIVSIVIIIIIMVTMIVIIVIIIISIFIVIKISHRHNWLPKFPKQYLMLRSGKCKWLESWLIYFYLTDYSFPITNPKIIIVIVITFVIVRIINITNLMVIAQQLSTFSASSLCQLDTLALWQTLSELTQSELFSWFLQLPFSAKLFAM